ncbi:hypothetical protein OG21DRAFT_1426703, partial [Imleria badia]
ILTHFHPMDLLNMARTCKYFRKMLMAKSSAFVWKSARYQVGLSDCPTDLTEPEYANLMFNVHCQGCGTYAVTIFWEIRRRYCLDCSIVRM